MLDAVPIVDDLPSVCTGHWTTVRPGASVLFVVDLLSCNDFTCCIVVFLWYADAVPLPFVLFDIDVSFLVEFRTTDLVGKHVADAIGAAETVRSAAASVRTTSRRRNGEPLQSRLQSFVVHVAIAASRELQVDRPCSGLPFTWEARSGVPPVLWYDGMSPDIENTPLLRSLSAIFAFDASLELFLFTTPLRACPELMLQALHVLLFGLLLLKLLLSPQAGFESLEIVCLCARLLSSADRLSLACLARSVMLALASQATPPFVFKISCDVLVTFGSCGSAGTSMPFLPVLLRCMDMFLLLLCDALLVAQSHLPSLSFAESALLLCSDARRFLANCCCLRSRIPAAEVLRFPRFFLFLYCRPFDCAPRTSRRHRGRNAPCRRAECEPAHGPDGGANPQNAALDLSADVPRFGCAEGFRAAAIGAPESELARCLEILLHARRPQRWMSRRWRCAVLLIFWWRGVFRGLRRLYRVIFNCRTVDRGAPRTFLPSRVSHPGTA